ncbi:GTPase-activating protein gyp7 [Alternaria alternata]|nr:GTPase-activating protein gyp7 [Alternaria alternata]
MARSNLFANNYQGIMNRWLNRKKDGSEDVAAAKKTKKGKKGQEEPKPEFDLSAALPKADDFRTSLIMPGLSTRFSMLKEQDDPDSKIGKASDDSVLQPKRQSRLHEFGFVPGGLSDIAEVSSLNGSIRPPFANERTNSFDSSRDDDGSGSMMSRARPGEGNVLFGGRQKIYMISNSNAKGTGRTLYDDDVNMSAYQRLRQEEKERLRQQAEENEGQHSEPSSPTELSRKRETSSSTNSGTVNTRTSTAATSIASQGTNSVTASSPAFPPAGAPMTSPDLSKSTTKRRLYDQGLDQQIQEQQSSAMNRLNSIQRARAPTGRSTPPISIAQARSATNLSDRFARGPGFRSDSPNSLQYPGVSRNNSSGASSPVLARPQSPALASPVISDSEEAHTLNAALQPNDRGKATAMGTFNKPKAAFSEEQYAERLRHMQQDREGRSTPTNKVEKSPPRKPTLRERAEQQRRKRAESDAKERSSSESTAEPSQAPSAFSRFQAAASQMRTAGPATPSSPPTQRLPEVPRQRSDSNKATFFSSPDSSDAEEEAPKPTVPHPMEPTRRFDNLPVATGPAPSIFEHPALRSRTTSEEEVSRTGPASYSPALTQEASPRPDETVKVDGTEVDSPTLGPDNGGLSGMIRQHLRNMSNVSSNYGEPGPPMMSPPMGLAIHTQEFGLQRRQPGSESVTPAPSTYSHSNPWDLDDIDNPYRDESGKMNSEDSINGQDATPLVMSATEPNPAAPWDLTPRRTHERIASNETEADHEAFQRDLAQRQRLIQENLRARAEGRSTSPAPGGPSGGLKTALNMLRAKSSRESFATVDVSNKSVRKLALGGTSANVSSTSLVGLQGDVPPLRPKQSRVLQQSEQDAQRELEHRQRSATESSRTGRPTGRSPQASTRSSTRERSSSGTSSGRSRSRPRPDQYRDDLDQAMTEGSRGAYPPNTMPSLPGYVAHPTPPLPAERPSLDSQGRMRSRSNSKTAAANYFESKHLHPIQTNTGSSQNSRLPPPQGKFSPGIPISPRPSPGGFNNGSANAFSHPTSPVPPFSANHTPPVSNPTTPSTTAFNPSTVQPLTKTGVLRKKSIAKSEISEPVFLSTTSSIDTINLPAGASLKNGMENDAPPVPPINPMRRRFGFGRGESSSPTGPSPYDPAVQPGMEAPRAPYGEPLRTNSSDGLMNQSQQPKGRLRKASSEGRSLRGNAQSQFGPSPAMPQNGFTMRNNSPPRPTNGPAGSQQPMEGGMF